MTCILYKNNILLLPYNVKTTKGIIVYLITNMAHDFFGKVGVGKDGILYCKIKAKSPLI